MNDPKSIALLIRMEQLLSMYRVKRQDIHEMLRSAYEIGYAEGQCDAAVEFKKTISEANIQGDTHGGN